MFYALVYILKIVINEIDYLKILSDRKFTITIFNFKNKNIRNRVKFPTAVIVKKVRTIFDNSDQNIHITSSSLL
ncbi:hypothetical protein GFV14_00395 [Candidatus Hartigia pinicola]|nr:hypothetical protein GFV14_00395 [Candidatus Hartigia pinicola]